jgi:hypothetical protein
MDILTGWRACSTLIEAITGFKSMTLATALINSLAL